jgi:hypothetical protein
MPEAAVHEDGYTSRGEREIRGDLAAAGIHSEAKTSVMQLTADKYFRGGGRSEHLHRDGLIQRGRPFSVYITGQIPCPFRSEGSGISEFSKTAAASKLGGQPASSRLGRTRTVMARLIGSLARRPTLHRCPSARHPAWLQRWSGRLR